MESRFKNGCQKYFDDWNKEKIKIDKNNIKEDFYINQREIWFTKMGRNIGFEENGKTDFLRPVLVLKKVGNLFLTVAMTSKGKDNNIFYYKTRKPFFNQNNQKHKDDSYIILSQIKVMDKKRFTENMGYVGKEEFLKIKEKLKALML